MLLSETTEAVPVCASYHEALDAWLSGLVQEVSKRPGPIHPVIQEFESLICGAPDLHMRFSDLFSHNAAISGGSAAAFRIKDVAHMLQLMNAVLTKSPEFNRIGLVGVLPVYSILHLLISTQPGSTLFLDARVNKQMKRILDTWGNFLRSENSRYVLDDNPRMGWFGEDARAAMPNFAQTFVCDPKAPYHGFKSWDDFFTRRFRSSVRPVCAPDDASVIVNACEAAPYKLAKGVRRTDTFWIKDYPYSLEHMLAGDSLIDDFVGGTVYQAFLSAFSYHRWHSPVDGIVIKARVEQGVYYWQAPTAKIAASGVLGSQGYTAQLSTRAIIFIKADNPDIGLMCVLPIGMIDVSTCELTVEAGQRVRKGDQLGMFHFGGSTHCLIFRPGVTLDFHLQGQTPGIDASNISLNERIATVGPIQSTFAGPDVVDPNRYCQSNDNLSPVRLE